jgi:GAF domain-containing protein
VEGVPSALDVELPTTRQAATQGKLVAVSEVATDGDGNAVARAALSVPIKLRGQVIGVIDLHEADETRTWTEHEVALAQAVADQMAQALESQRLFEQTQARAQREQLVSQITTRITTAASVQDMLRVASEELGKALGITRSVVRLRPQAASTQTRLSEKERSWVGTDDALGSVRASVRLGTEAELTDEAEP